MDGVGGGNGPWSRCLFILPLATRCSWIMVSERTGVREYPVGSIMSGYDAGKYTVSVNAIVSGSGYADGFSHFFTAHRRTRSFVAGLGRLTTTTSSTSRKTDITCGVGSLRKRIRLSTTFAFSYRTRVVVFRLSLHSLT